MTKRPLCTDSPTWPRCAGDLASEPLKSLPEMRHEKERVPVVAVRRAGFGGAVIIIAFRAESPREPSYFTKPSSAQFGGSESPPSGGITRRATKKAGGFREKTF